MKLFTYFYGSVSGQVEAKTHLDVYNTVIKRHNLPISIYACVSLGQSMWDYECILKNGDYLVIGIWC